MPQFVPSYVAISRQQVSKPFVGNGKDIQLDWVSLRANKATHTHNTNIYSDMAVTYLFIVFPQENGLSQK